MSTRTNKGQDTSQIMKELKIIDDWRIIALTLYTQLHGRRCCGCHSLVDIKTDGVMWECQGELILTHRKCAEKS